MNIYKQKERINHLSVKMYNRLELLLPEHIEYYSSNIGHCRILNRIERVDITVTEISRIHINDT